MTVTLPYDPSWRALEWAMEHCLSYAGRSFHQRGYKDYDLTMKWSDHYDQTKIDYFFADEKDALIFTLKWL